MCENLIWRGFNNNWVAIVICHSKSPATTPFRASTPGLGSTFRAPAIRMGPSTPASGSWTWFFLFRRIEFCKKKTQICDKKRININLTLNFCCILLSSLKSMHCFSFFVIAWDTLIQLENPFPLFWPPRNLLNFFQFPDISELLWTIRIP